MKNRIKRYLVFTGVWYRIVVYLLVPLALIGLGLWVETNIQSGTGLILVAVFLPPVEIISDNWLFGGIQTKDSIRLEFLKTSGRGMDVLKSALRMDLLRKFLWALGIMALFRLAAELAGKWTAGGAGGVMDRDVPNSTASAYGMGILLFFVLFSYFVSILGTFLSRFGDMLWINLLTGYGAIFIMAFGLMLLNLADYILIIDILMAILGMGISVLAVRVAMKRVERSYYDR